MSVDSLMQLARQGHYEEAFAGAMTAAADTTPQPADALRLGMLLMHSQVNTQREVGAKLLQPHIEEMGLPVDVVARYATHHWNRGNPKETARAARWALMRNPNAGEMYRLLGMALICLHEFEEAFYVLGAGAAAPESPQNNSVWQRLAHQLWSGVNTTEFKLNGKSYQFSLDIFSSQAMEAAAHHISGHLTEMEELETLRKEIGSGRSIVEVGILVGNHTLYFLNEMAPKSMVLIDGNDKSIQATRRNIEATFGAQLPCSIDLIHRFVGRDSCEVEFSGTIVTQEPLDALLTQPFDFIKIDVDGIELELLDGAMQVLDKNRPDILLEVDKANRGPAEELLGRLGYKTELSIDHRSYENLLLRIS